ncbi:MAG: MATE family efflux transporter [Bdellovibrionota bacterium]|nr:MATE family efflux transporter [Bdellovibrionota bacterium]
MKKTSAYRDFKDTLPLALPMISSQISYILMGAIDNIMVAKVGVDELATTAFCNNLYAIFIVTQTGLASAASPLISSAIGANQNFRVGKLLRHSMILLFLFSLLSVLGMLFVGFNMEWFDQTEAVNNLFWSYFPWLIATLPLVALYQSQRQFYDGIHHSKIPMAYNYLAIPLNAFFNWIFIFGKFGFPPMGIFGAGLATFLARFCIFILFTKHTFFNETYERLYRLSFKKFQMEKDIWKTIVKLGVPSSCQYLFEVGAFATAGILAGQLGKIEIASHQIALNIGSFTFMVAMGWSFAASVKIGGVLGKGEFHRIREMGFNHIKIVSVYMTIISILFFTFRYQLPLIYLDNEEITSLVAKILLIAGVFQLADGIQAVSIGILRGLQESLRPTIITMVSYWVIAIPLANYLAFYTDFQLIGIWIALAIGLSISATGLVILIHRVSKNIGEVGFVSK